MYLFLINFSDVFPANNGAQNQQDKQRMGNHDRS